MASTLCGGHDATEAPRATGIVTVTFTNMFTLNVAVCDECARRVRHYGKKMVRVEHWLGEPPKIVAFGD